jgi:hypothetical protein
MSKGISTRIGLTTVTLASAAALRAEEVEKNAGVGGAPELGRITFGGNFVVDPCTTCNYDAEPSGYAVVGPDN